MLYIDSDLPAGRVKRTHVNLWCVKRSAGSDPCITCKMGRSNYYGRAVYVDGPGRVVQAMDKPLSCGARVYIETSAAARVRQDAPEEPGGDTYIHVSQATIRSNLAAGRDEPCVVVLRGGEPVYARTLVIDGPFVMIQTGTSIRIVTAAATREARPEQALLTLEH